MKNLLKLNKSSLLLLFLFGCVSPPESARLTAESLVEDSEKVIESFRQHKYLKTFEEYVAHSHAIMIFPGIIKGGFFWGGEAGNGILLTRAADSSWSYPSFVTLGAASFGLQAGVQEASTLLIIKSAGALEAILNHQIKLGADTSAAIGVVGIGMEASTTSNLDADILVFASPKIGTYVGFSLEGAVIARRQDLNKGYYGQSISSKAINLGDQKNPQAEQLRKLLETK